jgi:hypothetical protein
MAEDKITLESGKFDWEVGRGYETPADGRLELPPGWGDPPEFKDREQPVPVAPRGRHIQGAIQTTEIPPIAGVIPVYDPALAALTAISAMPSERVNLDTGTAVFRGHEITLSDDGAAAIKTILAMEVCRMLDEEKSRVLTESGIGAMFQQEMPGNGRRGAEDMPGMPGPAEPMESEAQGSPREVQ